MKKEIENRIEELSIRVNDYRKIIVSINDEIESGNFKPSEAQKKTISYVANQGRKALVEIERLEGLINDITTEE